MFKKLMLVAMVLGLALTACAPAASPAPVQKEAVAGYATGGGAAVPPGLPQAAPAADNFAASTANTARDAVAQHSASGAQTADRLVIKTVSLSLVVKDPAAAADSITTLATSLGGYVVSSNIAQASTDAAGNRIMQATLSIRVPVDKLDDARAQLKRLAVNGQPVSETITGEDVTAQYTDLDSQLRNLQAAETQLQKIMDDAKKTEDVLSVYSQLVSIRGQIEQVKGQMKFFQESAALSLINLTLEPDVLAQPIQVGGWRPEGVAKDAVEALVQALQGVASAGIWLGIYILPLALLIGLPLYFGGRWLVRRVRKPKAKPAVQA